MSEKLRAVSICRTCFEPHAAADLCPTCHGGNVVAHPHAEPIMPPRRNPSLFVYLSFAFGATAFAVILLIVRS